MANQPFTYCPTCGTALQEAFVDGRHRQRCPACSWVHYRNPLPVAIAFTLNRNDELLVIRRAHEPAYNEWALPGGFLEAGEHPEEGCLRELQEETALHGRVEGLIGVYHRESKVYGSLLAVAYRVRALHEEISINHEVYEAGFYRPESMPEIGIPLHREIVAESRWEGCNLLARGRS